MNQSSDSESGDSDRGIRYKTNSTRDVQVSSPTRIDKCGDEFKSIGPSLPPHLQRRTVDAQCREQKAVGPELPPHFQKNMPDLENDEDEEIKLLGPALPPPLQKKINYKNVEDLVESTKPQVIGPSLPPHLQTVVIPESNAVIIGPALPPQFKTSCESADTKYVGPVLPDHLREQLSQATESQSDDEEEMYGPIPVGFSHSKAHVELEERALQMKIDMLNPKGENEPAREEWMLELPAAKAASFGLGPRQFRAKAAPDLSDRSSWTDTPEDRAKKKERKEKAPADIKKDAELREQKTRDKEQEAIAKKCKRSKESLVDIHTKKMKMKDDESGPSERRPFSREVDLKVNRFDEAQKKAVLKKAQLLDTRFSAGQSKFL